VLLHAGTFAWARTLDGKRSRAAAPEAIGAIEIATNLNAAVMKVPVAPPVTSPSIADAPRPSQRAVTTLASKPPSPRPPSPSAGQRDDHLRERFVRALTAVAAGASRILTSPAGNGPPIASGNADRAFGVVGGDGTGTSPTFDQRAGRPGAAEPPPLPDRSRRASVFMGYNEDCDFPAEADRDRIDHGWAMLIVTVRQDGSAAAVQVLDDSGHGFGRMARQCALRARYRPALDRRGVPVQSDTPAFRYRFTR
jgi:protein TonB